MDEDDEAHRRRQQEKARKRAPQHKYKNMLQQLADRKRDEIVIDLDDLATVRLVDKTCGTGFVLTAVLSMSGT